MRSRWPAYAAVVPSSAKHKLWLHWRSGFTEAMPDVSKLETFLRNILAALERAGIAHMLTGSLASSMWGIPRATNDIDFVINPIREELFTLARLFRESGLYFPREIIDEAFDNRSQLNVIDFSNGWKADLILRKDREFSVTEFRRREEATVEGMHLHIATPEDVIIAKLEWWTISPSDRQLNDIIGVLQVQRDNLDMAYIERWVELLGLEEPWSEARKQAG